MDDEEAIPSTEDLYTILGMASRTGDEVPFKADFIPGDKTVDREVVFKMKAHNYAPRELHAAKSCADTELTAKRISTHVDKIYTLDMCNTKCKDTSGCLMFAHSEADAG